MQLLERIAQSSRLWWSAVVIWATVIFAGSSISGTGVPSGIAPYAHFIEYAILGALLYLALRASTQISLPVAIVVAALLASLYGITDEVHQMLVPGRTPDVLDWVTDTAGALVGAAVAAGVFSRRRSAPL